MEPCRPSKMEGKVNHLVQDSPSQQNPPKDFVPQVLSSKRRGLVPCVKSSFLHIYSSKHLSRSWLQLIIQYSKIYSSLFISKHYASSAMQARGEDHGEAGCPPAAHGDP